MRRGRMRTWAGLGILALLVGSPVRAQAPQVGLSPPPGAPSGTPPATIFAPSLPAGLPAAVPSPFTPAPAAPVLPDGKLPVAEPLEPQTNQAGDHPAETPHEDDCGPCKGLFFTGEYLLLHARRNAHDFAVLSPNQNLLPGGTINSLDWQTRSGFRFGAGYQLPDSHWQVGAYYTYFHSGQNNQTLTAPPGGALYSTLSRAGGVDDVNSASGFTSIDYNVIDLELARPLALGPTFWLRPFVGGRFAWIDQQLGAIYNGGSANAVNDFVSSPVYFRGGGLTAGALGFWNIYRSLGIYASGRGSLLSGQFRNFLTETNNNGATNVLAVYEKYYQVVPVAELGMGIGWQSEHMNIRIGYQLINWFSMVNSPDFNSSSNIGKVSRRTSDLSLEGLAVQLGFIF